MLELMLCSALTVLPDFLFRRFVQGKRIGREITLFSVWYELRWGITLCLMLTITLITTIFYFHPSTTSAVSFFRTISILPESNGRVAEVYVNYRDQVKAGQPLVQARQHGGGSGHRNRAPQDHGSRGRHAGRQVTAGGGRGQAHPGARRLAAGHRRVQHPGRTAAAQCQRDHGTRGGTGADRRSIQQQGAGRRRHSPARTP